MKTFSDSVLPIKVLVSTSLPISMMPQKNCSAYDFFVKTLFCFSKLAYFDFLNALAVITLNVEIVSKQIVKTSNSSVTLKHDFMICITTQVF